MKIYTREIQVSRELPIEEHLNEVKRQVQSMAADSIRDHVYETFEEDMHMTVVTSVVKQSISSASNERYHISVGVLNSISMNTMQQLEDAKQMYDAITGNGN